jgi:opacity protein-like surface antigen
MHTRFLTTAVAVLLSAIAAAADWTALSVTPCPAPPEPPLLAVAAVAQAPVLDGALAEPLWAEAHVIERLPLAGGGTTAHGATAWITRDADYLYVGLECEEPSFATRRVTAQPGEDKWPGDAVEIFIDPGATGHRHFQFVTNADGVRNDWGPGADRAWDGVWQVATGRWDKGWTAEIRISLRNWDFPTDRHVWGFNITRQRAHAVEGALVAELASWAPVGNTFHATDRFGRLFFGSPKAWADRRRVVRLAAVLDRDRYTVHEPLAQLALHLRSGRAEACTIDLTLRPAGSDQRLRRATLTGLPSPLAGIDLPLAGLPAGSYELRLQPSAAGSPPAAPVVLPLRIEPVVDTPPVQGRVTLRQTATVAAAIPRWHVRTGVPLPRGAASTTETMRITHNGTPVPGQFVPLATWSKGGSIKWVRVDAQLPLAAGQHAELELRYGTPASPPPAGIALQQSADAFTIDTGAARFRIRRHGFNLIDAMWIGDRQLVQPGAGRGPYMTAADGTVFRAEHDQQSSVVIEEAGPLTVVVRAEGAHRQQDGTALGRYVVRLTFHRDYSYIGVQHTFVVTEDTNTTRYADIGLAFPFTGDRYAFGTDTGTAVAGRTGDACHSLLQRRWDSYVVKRIDGHAVTTRAAAGGRAPGWCSVETAAGAVALFVREMWQNFPKELTITPQAMTFHAWPKHGEVVDPERAYSAANIWRFWFCHEGDLLDFRFPASHNPPEMKKEARWAGDSAAKSNAIGLAKTHDMLLVFGDAARPAAAAALHAAFDQGVHFLPAPTATSASRALGYLSPAAPERFPNTEAHVSDGFDFVVHTTLDVNNAYGMFNYGDSFTHWKTEAPALPPSYLRLWNGYHHGRPRTPWLLYVRSGDAKYLRWARANSRHVADIDTCHFAPESFRHHRQWSSRKAVGGMCDYKGTVHWHTGHRVDYNSMVDFLLYGYYLTADARLWDVALEVGRYVTDQGVAQPSRHGGGVISAALDYYKATWDVRAMARIRGEWLPKMLTKPAYDHRPPSVGWAPYLEPYIALTGDQAAEQFLLQFAAHRYGSAAVHPLRPQHYGDGRALAAAYRLSGQRRYALSALAYLEMGPGLYRRDGDKLSGLVDWYPYSYSTMQGVYALAAAADLSPPPAPLEIPYWEHAGGPGTSGVRWRHSRRRRLTILLPETTDGAFTVGGRYGSYGDLSWRLLRPDGEVVTEGSRKRPPNDQQRLIVKAPADAVTGLYRFEISGSSSFYFHYAEISSLGTHRFAVPPAHSGESLKMFKRARWYFRVPADCQEFAIHVSGKQVQKQGKSVGEIYGPDGRARARCDLDFAQDDVLKVRPAPGERGRIWSLAGYSLDIRDVSGIPRWFAARPAGCPIGQ